MDIMTWENRLLYGLLIWASFICQLVNSILRDWERGWDGGIVILAFWEYHFIRVHENLVEHSSNFTSIEI